MGMRPHPHKLNKCAQLLCANINAIQNYGKKMFIQVLSWQYLYENFTCYENNKYSTLCCNA